MVGALQQSSRLHPLLSGISHKALLSRAVANRLSATGGRIAAGRGGAAMDWMFVEGRDADAHEMVFGDRYQEERPTVGGGACTLDGRCSGHPNCYLKCWRELGCYWYWCSPGACAFCVDGHRTALRDLTCRSAQLRKVSSLAVHARYNTIRAAKLGVSEVASALTILMLDNLRGKSCLTE